MDEKGLKLLVEADALERARIIAQGDAFHIEIDSSGRSFVVQSAKGALRTWRTIDAAAKWLRTVGIAESLLDVSKWQPNQRALPLSGCIQCVTLLRPICSHKAHHIHQLELLYRIAARLEQP